MDSVKDSPETPASSGTEEGFGSFKPSAPPSVTENIEPQPINDEEPVQKKKPSKVAKVILAFLVVLSILGGLVIAGVYAYDSLKPKVAEIETTVFDGGSYSLSVPNGYEMIEGLSTTFVEPGDDINTKSSLIVSKLTAIVGDRDAYIKKLNETITQDSLQSSVSNVVDSEAARDVKFESGKNGDQEYWRFNAVLYKDDQKAGSVSTMIQAGKTSAYSLTVAVHATDPGLEAKTAEILDSFLVK